MQQLLNKEKLQKVKYEIGNEELLETMPTVKPHGLFDDEVLEFLNKVSAALLADSEAKGYPDIVTLAFYLRKAHLLQMKEEYAQNISAHQVGRGMAFHIAPSNVPVNYMYSLITGLLTGNANVIKVPSKDFPQVSIINRVLKRVLDSCEAMKPYVVLVRYGHDREVNDALSEYADVRIIWGGDNTISEIRKSPLAAREIEVTFADRYSLSVIDSDKYLNDYNSKMVANDFYNDTFLTDQNACTSPRVVVWTGSRIEEAKKEFWSRLHELVSSKYSLQPVQAVNKLTKLYIAAACLEDVSKVPDKDNLIYRINVKSVDDSLMKFKDNSGYFYEYDCGSIVELEGICNNTHCQTIGYIGDSGMFDDLLKLRLKGVDRIVPVGKTMDFEFIWDGYELISSLTRKIRVL